ncbi:glucose 1-dehydrogenase [Bacillus sp. JJ1533]|uniref:SDR family NAD(P)-dependent oxidoreductase n=1 Tax=Bacillus sp. JJ1533 TaxID=3122959 RepID=UPI002FFF965B
MKVESMFNLNGKVAIVSGASKGIGREISIMLARAGADLAIIARSKNELKELASEIKNTGRKALPISFDLLEVDLIPEMVAEIYNHFGKIDILVNNAGTNIPKSALEVKAEDWDRVMNLNLRSVFFLTQAVGRYMVERKKGKIINMSSQMAYVGYYKRAAYCSSKGGLMQLTRALAIEWAEHKINVNSIAPTFIETPMTGPMFEDKEFYNDVISRIPLGRLAKVGDLYGAVLFLCSESSNMVTGQTIPIDGGWTVW